MPTREGERWLLAGLGNPGQQYELTPHNMGFLVVDRLAERHSIRVTRKESQALLGVGRMGQSEVFLAKPQTYMNNSGPSVHSLLVKHDIPVEHLLLIFDEIALPWGALRIKPQGSAGGHNGVSSVIRSVGTQSFPRLRLGIHPGHPVMDMAAFVLGQFKRVQVEELGSLLDEAADAAESILAKGVEVSMAKYNRRAPGQLIEEA